ncbi:DUF1456 family protein [Ferrimonas lipolytica]|uniref:DUF1456 family protein n=1 Tax=Ferrimonas lipolytica TaxID=2724191 RepID=A0A6H1UAD5_9GAMM|nr:DUF1456 family protein [Ferrimonas lipolytica]QIZ76011.1 DUF1456 family protein [Ferrimonas lipolytica]
MINNDVLRMVRDLLEYDDATMTDVFALAEHTIDVDTVHAMLLTNGDQNYQKCDDELLATFLNGLINKLRGKKEGALPLAETHINNNGVFMKLRIALNLQAEQVLETLALGGVELSKHELSAFFRKPNNKHYRDCNDATLVAFLRGAALR